MISPLKMIATSSDVLLRPHHEGNNVMAWIGFKHVMYLAEEAVLEHLRASGLGFRVLLEKFGLVPEFVNEQGRILTALKVGDEVHAKVSLAEPKAPALWFDVTLQVERGGKQVKAYKGRLALTFRRDHSLGLAPATISPPADLEAYLVDDLGTGEPAPSPAVEGPSLIWRVSVPYFYCHGNDRLKMSGYLRLMEEADSRFCEQQGIGVGRLLRRSRWIPAVPNARMVILSDVLLDEELEIVYRVSSVTRTLLYTCEMEVFTDRNGVRVRVASGEIVHGYARITDRADWEMVSFDAEVVDALTR